MFLLRALHQVICDQCHVHVLWMNRFHELLGHGDIYGVNQDTPWQRSASLAGEIPGVSPFIDNVPEQTGHDFP